MIPDSEDAMFDIWVDPETHDFANRCPWLQKKQGADLYECTIYDVMPAACREWPSNIARGQNIGCPACGEGIKDSKPRRGDD